MAAKKLATRRPARPKPRKSANKQKQEAALERALEDTFPSSDPIALTQPTTTSKRKSRR
jgi:aminoglycoside phosphotransferase (APT) family kinase protein